MDVVGQILVEGVFGQVGFAVQLEGVDAHVLGVELLVDVDLHELGELGSFECTKDGLGHGQRVASKGVYANMDVGQRLGERQSAKLGCRRFMTIVCVVCLCRVGSFGEK